MAMQNLTASVNEDGHPTVATLGTLYTLSSESGCLEKMVGKGGENIVLNISSRKRNLIKDRQWVFKVTVHLITTLQSLAPRTPFPLFTIFLYCTCTNFSADRLNREGFFFAFYEFLCSRGGESSGLFYEKEVLRLRITKPEPGLMNFQLSEA